MLKFFAEKMWVAFAVQKLLTFFSAKNIRILYIDSAKTVNEMTLNELVKLTTLWTTGPWIAGPLIVKKTAYITFYTLIVRQAIQGLLVDIVAKMILLTFLCGSRRVFNFHYSW